MHGSSVADAHSHSNPVKGIGARNIVKKFKSSGGWFIALVMLPTWDYGIQLNSLDDFKRAAEHHIRECREARSEIKTSCFIGLHPAEIDKLVKRGMRLDKVYELSKSIIDYIVSLYNKGVIDGVGEVGRPHYKTLPESILVSEYILKYTLELQRDYEFPLQLHLENTRGFTSWSIRNLVDEVKPSLKSRILVHHAKPGVLEEVVKEGFWASTPGIYNVLREAFRRVRSNLDKLLVESDFIDDPRRPGVVTTPWELCEALNKLVSENLIDVDTYERVNVTNVIEFFNI